jgi:hypothetical protein
MDCFLPMVHKIARLKPLFRKKDMRKEKCDRSLFVLPVSSRIVELTENNNLVNYLKGKKYVHVSICVCVPSQHSGRRNRNVRMSLVKHIEECLKF